MIKYHSHGKLLLTGEYVVLDGAMALAVPTKFGQSLEVEPGKNQKITWKSLDEKGQIWFETEFPTEEILSSRNRNSAEVSVSSDLEIRLKQVLREAHLLNPNILLSGYGFSVVSALEFPQNWGLGTSSTLINNVAQWFRIDAFELLSATFGGSGYDVAAAQNFQPFTYQLQDSKRTILAADFDPGFKDELFFVYLNKKQDSRESIAQYRKQELIALEENVEKISRLTESFIHCQSLDEFKLLIEVHETLISKIIKIPKIKTRLFPDYPGAVKSLGGWGGDFVLATGNREEQEYFRGKGYHTIVPYSEMVL